MSQIITATFVDGVLKPEQELGLPPGAKVRLILDLQDDDLKQRREACAELDRLCEELPIEHHGHRLTRDQLHERR